MIEHQLKASESFDGLIDLDVFTSIHTVFVDEIGDPAIGIKYGRFLSSSDHGPMGALSSVSSSNLEYLKVQSKYMETRMATKIEVVESNGWHRVKLVHSPELKEIQMFHNHVLVTSLITALSQESGLSCPEAVIRFPFQSKVEYSKYFKQDVKLNQEFCEVLIPSTYLNKPTLHSDPASKVIYEKICVEIKERLRAGNTISHSILALLDTHNTYPSLEYVSSKFHMTSRTLTNKLAKESTSYREIVKQHRMDSAEKLLKNSNLTVEAISEECGYSSVGNFCRAFKNNFGKSPSSYREKGRKA